MFHLTVIQEFHHKGRHWKKGDHIEDSGTVDEILNSELFHYVTKVSDAHEDVHLWQRRVDEVFKPVVSETHETHE